MIKKQISQGNRITYIARRAAWIRFAASALGGLVGRYGDRERHQFTVAEAREYADCMLSELDKQDFTESKGD